MDQKPFIDLLPSEQLKSCIAERGHRFRDRELIVITERYAKTFAQRQSLLRQLAEHCREENDRSFAAELYRQHERAMDSVRRSDPGTVYYVEIITDEDSPAEHAVCASFEAALRTVQAFGQEFACPFTDDSEIRIVKETLFGQTIDFDRQLLGEVNLTKELQPGGYVEAWDDDEEQITVWDLYDAESENNVLYPKILKQPCSPVRFPARFGAEYGMQISRFRCNEYDDAYVIRLDSPSVSAEDLTNFHNAHRHIPIPTLEQVDLNELPELERKNYLRLEKYLKKNGMIKERGKKMEKDYPITGAGEKTPSIPYYFSWINNTNEGSTERQTLINLDFFRYMRETYGMQIRIYAWDAGNFDGAAQGYGDVNGEKFRSQFPDGYKNVVEKAAQLGIRFGLWGSPDGFGDTPEEEKERVDFFVHLCRDYHFAAFKLDGVCGTLRPEKAKTYAAMIEECRKYSPDLILLNHRLDFYEAQKYITTFLWNGDETYTDVFAHNRITAPHHRAYTFTRGNVTDENGNLLRLAEDHGVCLSSALDYFEDDLMYQAFGRCLIAAPEIYGNPWFLKDAELARLARIYNLHARWAEILVNGILLPPEFGANAVSRGSDKIRLICTGNDTWETKTILLPIDETIGLNAGNEQIRVIVRFPYERFVGCFDCTERVEIELPPFRAVLIEVAAEDLAAPVLTNCEYETVRETDGVPEQVRIVKSGGGEVYLLNAGTGEENGGEAKLFCIAEAADETERPPEYLGSLTERVEDPAVGEAIYEAAMFAIDNDSLEARCHRRSGDTEIPEVQAARDAFFNQKTYILRGCEAAAMFDGDESTFFDGQSRCYCDHDLRIGGGCLRVDFGETVDADSIVIECFSVDEPTREVPAQQIPQFAEYAENFSAWKKSGEAAVADCGKMMQQIVKFTVHTIYETRGSRLRVTYPIGGKLRYLRIAEPMDRIFSITVLSGGAPVKLHEPCANNMQAHYAKRPTKLLKSAEFTIPEHRAGAYLALAVNGDHGAEGVYCTAELDGQLLGFEDRAPSYKANVWEHMVCDEPVNNTFCLALPENAAGKKIRLYASFSTLKGDECNCKVYLCDKHR